VVKRFSATTEEEMTENILIGKASDGENLLARIMFVCLNSLLPQLFIVLVDHFHSNSREQVEFPGE